MSIMKKGQGKLGVNRISQDGNILTFPLWIANSGKESIKRTTRKDLEHAIKAAMWSSFTIYKAYANLNLDTMDISTIKEIGGK